MKRAGLLAVALGAGLVLLGPWRAPAAPAVVSAIFVGTHGGRLQVEIRGSQPLNYAIIEGANPFSVSLLLLNATFGFPPEERRFPGPGLTKIRTTVLERDGSRLGRLDLTFATNTRYQVIKDGSRLLVRVDAPAVPGGFALGQPPGPSRARPAPAPAAAPVVQPPAPVPLILELRPEITLEEARVIVGANGPLTYKSSTMENPFRVVVDFEVARIARKEDTIEIGDVILKRIRSSQFSATSVRVVLDLARPTPFWIEAQAKGVVIHLGRTGRP